MSTQHNEEDAQAVREDVFETFSDAADLVWEFEEDRDHDLEPCETMFVLHLEMAADYLDEIEKERGVDSTERGVRDALDMFFEFRG